MTVNGEQTALVTTLLALLEQRGHNPERVAVERNGAIVPRAAFSETTLAESDRIEIVSFVGGG